MHAQNTIDALVTSVEELDRSRRAHDTWRALQDRRDRRAIIEPTTYESSPYKETKP